MDSSHSNRSFEARDMAWHPLAKACDQCHRCKVACDGGRPTCDRCMRNSSVCTYSTGKPIGKPKGSKNRSKSDTQKATTANEINSTSITQLPANDGFSKRKINAGTVEAAHQLANHKRQRPSVCLPSPTSSTDRMLELSNEPFDSPGSSLEQSTLQHGYAPSAHSTLTPEFPRMHLSPLQSRELEPGLSFDHDMDFMQNRMSNMINSNQHRTTMDAYLSIMDPSSFNLPALPLAEGSPSLNGMASNKSSIDGSQENGQTVSGCTCNADSLAVILELQQHSMGRVKLSVDGVLGLTRRGTYVISNHLSCSYHSRTTPSQTSLLACIFILMQITSCYAYLRSSLENLDYPKHLSVSVGGLPIEEDELRRHVYNAVLDAEIRKAATLTTRLEQWGGHPQMGSNALPCESLLSFVRSELDRVSEQRRRA